MNDTKNSLLQTAVKVWLRLLLASIMCFVVWVSVDAVSLTAFGQVTGYQVYQYDENGANPELINEHIFTAGEDRSAEIKVEENQQVIYTREIPRGADAVMGVVTSVCTWLIFALFPYNTLWGIGSHDDNYVQLGRMQEDKLFGLKVGVVASIPSAILYLLLVLGKFGVFPNVIIRWHRLLNPAFIPYIDAIEQGASAATELSVGALLAVGVIWLFVPFVCWLAYYLGYRQISIREKLVYKKNSAKK